MFIDVCPRHADGLMRPFEAVDAEHHGYLDQLNALDLRDEAQALWAIRTWLLPGSEYWSPTGRYQRREMCRFALMRGRCFGGCWLPGISSLPDADPASLEIFRRDVARFQRLVWRELFPEEQYLPRPQGIYRQRVDFGFHAFPDWPGEWGTPEYKPW